MSTTIRLWLVAETDLARRYCKFDPKARGKPDEADLVWVPKSIVEHTSKRGDEHEVKLPDWFIERENL